MSNGPEVVYRPGDVRSQLDFRLLNTGGRGITKSYAERCVQPLKGCLKRTGKIGFRAEVLADFLLTSWETARPIHISRMDNGLPPGLTAALRENGQLTKAFLQVNLFNRIFIGR
jgi:hypothetical protein